MLALKQVLKINFLLLVEYTNHVDLCVFMRERVSLNRRIYELNKRCFTPEYRHSANTDPLSIIHVI